MTVTCPRVTSRAASMAALPDKLTVVQICQTLLCMATIVTSGSVMLTKGSPTPGGRPGDGPAGGQDPGKISLMARACRSRTRWADLKTFSHCHSDQRIISQTIQITQSTPETTVKLLEVNFASFGKSFHLILKPCPRADVSVDILQHGKSRTKATYTVTHFCGKDLSIPSFVHGSLRQGIFTGVVHTRYEDYYIEGCPLANITGTNTRACLCRMSGEVAAERWQEFQKLVDMRSLGSSSGKAGHQTQTQGQRSRRDATWIPSCPLHVCIDDTFLQLTGAGEPQAALEKVFFYVLEADRIFQSSDFNGDGSVDGIGLHIERVTVLEDEESAREFGLPPGETNSTVLLNAFSTADHSDVCLAVLFTGRSLQGGIVGMAWIASSAHLDYAGGICQGPVTFQGQEFSFNTLLVTAMLHGQVVPDGVLALTLAHELGHAFGSPHDEEDLDPDCSPGPPDGYYIMHPYAARDDLPNNQLFSECSLAYMGPVIDNKGWCLEPREAGLCGDGLVQAGEECDCGSPDQCLLTDPCCTVGCRLKLSASCSPAVSPCCSATCQAVEAGEKKICRPGTDCLLPGLCDGLNTDCPAPESRPDFTFCQQGAALCVNGSCTLTRCAVHNLTECQCLNPTEARCQLCCYQPSSDTCLPFVALNDWASPGPTIYHLPGKQCMHATGFCTAQHTCMQPHEDSAADQFHSFFLPTQAGPIGNWCRERWGLFLAVGFLLFGTLACVFGSLRQAAPVRSLALATARMSVLWRQVELERQHLEERLDSLYEIWSAERHLVKHVNPGELSTLLARLCLFFPTASPSEVTEAAIGSRTESAAVDRLITAGYPLRKLTTDSSVMSD